MKSIIEMLHLDLIIQESKQKQIDIPKDLSEIGITNSISLYAFDVDSSLQDNSLCFRDDIIESPEDDTSQFADQSSIFNQDDQFTLKESIYFKDENNDHEIELRKKLRLITNANISDTLN